MGSLSTIEAARDTTRIVDNRITSVAFFTFTPALHVTRIYFKNP